jgi:hypothetical protein
VDPLQERCVSEVAGVEVLRVASGKTYLLATGKDTALPRKTVLGGFGTGSYVPTTDTSPGLVLSFPHGDKTLVQLDESTVKQDSTSMEVMSFYKLLVTLERVKHVTEHKVSYCSVKHTAAGADSTQDGFTITVETAMKYKLQSIGEPKSAAKKKASEPDDAASKKSTCKNVFGWKPEAVYDATAVAPMFRFRFERVGANLKVQKPYVVTTRAIMLTTGKPVQATAVF